MSTSALSAPPAGGVSTTTPFVLFLSDTVHVRGDPAMIVGWHSRTLLEAEVDDSTTAEWVVVVVVVVAAAVAK
jgi:hypothetical protein